MSLDELSTTKDDDGNQKDEGEKKACIACGETIAEAAVVCVHCKSDQSQWRNELKYWAGVAGVFTLIASGIAFTANLGFQLWQRVLGHELAVTNVDAFGKTVVWNLTNNPIYLRTINVVSHAPINNLVWEVHRVIPPKKNIDNLELLKIAAGSWYGPPGKIFGVAPSEYAQLTVDEFADAQKNLHTDKYVPTFLTPNSESFGQLTTALGKNFRTFECQMKVTFVRLVDGTASWIEVPCKGAFRFRGKSG